jgi:hypothetical protein
MNEEILRQILAVLVQNQLLLEALVTGQKTIPNPPRADLDYARMLNRQRVIIEGLEKAAGQA